MKYFLFSDLFEQLLALSASFCTVEGSSAIPDITDGLSTSNAEQLGSCEDHTYVVCNCSLIKAASSNWVL